MKPKQILLCGSIAVLACLGIVISGHRAEGLYLAFLPTSIAIWLLIDRQKSVLGMNSNTLRDALNATVGIAIIFYSAWMFTLSTPRPDTTAKGSLAMGLGLLILGNLAVARHQRSRRKYNRRNR